MSSRSAYALGLAIAASALVACGSSTASSGPTFAAPSTPDGMPSIRLSAFPTPSVDPNDPSVAQCRKDLVAVTDASHDFFQEKGYYAADMARLVQARLIKSVPTDLTYDYIQADTEPTIRGTVTGC